MVVTRLMGVGLVLGVGVGCLALRCGDDRDRAVLRVARPARVGRVAADGCIQEDGRTGLGRGGPGRAPRIGIELRPEVREERAEFSRVRSEQDGATMGTAGCDAPTKAGASASARCNEPGEGDTTSVASVLASQGRQPSHQRVGQVRGGRLSGERRTRA
jgi:hypothetical protein